ncbi:otogelin-like protein [Salvelinus alpinus]
MVMSVLSLMPALASGRGKSTIQERVTSPCHRCVCQHGTFQCVFHPCPSMCTAYGDRHYRTFDGLLFDYVGVCKVYLVKIGGTIVSYMDGCCKTCKEDGKSCQKVTVRMTIRKNDCRSNRPVNIVSCDGKCPSASIYNYNINTYARFCKCCREMGLQRRSVQLYCTGNLLLIHNNYN